MTSIITLSSPLVIPSICNPPHLIFLFPLFVPGGSRRAERATIMKCVNGLSQHIHRETVSRAKSDLCSNYLHASLQNYFKSLWGTFNWLWSGLNLIPMPHILHQQMRPLARGLEITILSFYNAVDPVRSVSGNTTKRFTAHRPEETICYLRA